MKKLIPFLLLAFAVAVLNWEIGLFRDAIADRDAIAGNGTPADITECAQKKDQK